MRSGSCGSAPPTEEREDDGEDTNDSTEIVTPTWCPAKQIYIGGIVPDGSSAQVQKLIDDNEGRLRLFGYGSLCWGPGSGTLSRPGVTTTPGRARGYKRCWSQKSADHRGTPDFPGIVCTLLRDDEVEEITKKHHDAPTMTEGLLYTVPTNLVQECLAELDFREKGGYARDVIDVVEDETGNVVKALLYRGTPDNPAFWTRALVDLPFAAAIISQAIGPSGRNDVYLHNLDDFMKRAAESSPAAARALLDHTGDTDTGDLSAMVQTLDESCDLFFLFVSGSNQHNQLLMKSEDDDVLLKNGEDAWELTETAVCTRRHEKRQVPKALLAGGGHSGLLTERGNLYLWGWNQHGQLGTSSGDSSAVADAPLSYVDPLHGIFVEKAALGFSHNLVIEKDTLHLYAFGDNGRGQVDGTLSAESIGKPVTPAFANGERFVDVAAGLFHSAAITSEGEVVTFGCGRFGQCLSNDSIVKEGGTPRWSPDDGSKLMRVACGRRHTVVLDERGRAWTFGENKYGQLGRSTGDRKFDAIPGLVESVVGNGVAVSDVECGWSHTVARLHDKKEVDGPKVFGWGRNDKGQLGTGAADNLLVPTPVFESVKDIQSVVCGSESTMVLNGAGVILGCGWNEHGNLALGTDIDSLFLQPITGARVVAPPSTISELQRTKEERILMASGGAHFMAMKV